jgi:phospholipid-binding lipoprotein MlaA
MTSRPHRAVQWLLLPAVLLLSGCASAPPGPPHDPFESTNRAVYQFNDDLDRAVLKPAAQTWREVVPEPGRVVQGATNLARFGVNSVLGLFGVFDVATPMGFARADTDLGETLTTWGVASGPYVVLPFMGPSTVRGTTGQLLQWQTYHPLQNVADTPYYSLHTMRLIDARARWLEASDLAASMALDPYSLVRDSYWQRMQAREAQLRALAPPPPAR